MGTAPGASSDGSETAVPSPALALFDLSLLSFTEPKSLLSTKRGSSSDELAAQTGAGLAQQADGQTDGRREVRSCCLLLL